MSENKTLWRLAGESGHGCKSGVDLIFKLTLSTVANVSHKWLLTLKSKHLEPLANCSTATDVCGPILDGVLENPSVTKSQSLSPGRILFPVLQTLAKTLVSFWVSCLREMHLTQYVEPSWSRY